MKQFFLFAFLSISLISFSQDSTLVEQYCRLEASPRAFTNKLAIDVDFGNIPRKESKDYRVRDELTGKIKNFNTVVDALNYMGSQGWILVNAFPLEYSKTSPVYHYYFKKLVPLSAIEK